VLQRNNLHDAVCLVCGGLRSRRTAVVALLSSVSLTPHAFCLPSSSEHEIMPSLTSTSVLNDAQSPCLYAFYSSPPPESGSSICASMQKEGKALRASPLLCASSPWERIAHTHHKSREKTGSAFCRRIEIWRAPTPYCRTLRGPRKTASKVWR